MSQLMIPNRLQEQEYSCGAACLAAVLTYWGVWAGIESELYGVLGTTCEGTSGTSLVTVVKSYGLMVESRSNLTMGELRDYLYRGKTVILSIQSGEMTGWDEGHYVVLAGMEDNTITLMDPEYHAYRLLTMEQLITCWHDYTDTGDKDWYAGIIIDQIGS